MATNNFFDNIQIDIFSATPKYMQLAQSIIKAVDEGRIHKNDVVPSINETSYEFEISRDTAEKAYKYLKKIGLLGSVPGKSYYIKNKEVKASTRVFLLFNKLSTHKKIIYDSFVKTLGNEAMIDFYIYNNDFGLFKKLIERADTTYTHYVIITHFLDSGKSAFEILNTLPKEKLILLDKLVANVSGSFGAVYEDFEEDIYQSLVTSLPRLKKYNTIKIIVPESTYFPDEITKGFNKFCKQYQVSGNVIHDINAEVLEKGTAYISLMENDLVTLVEKISENKFIIGSDVGVISYNETPLKRIILSGITTFSTDFEKMGQEAAKLVLNKSSKRIAIPFKVTLRPSL
ncbi:MAG: substrate-binding domain-containing protein [Niabella sp.]